MEKAEKIKLKQIIKTLDYSVVIVVLNIYEDPLYIGFCDIGDEDSRFDYIYNEFKNNTIISLYITPDCKLEIILNTRRGWTYKNGLWELKKINKVQFVAPGGEKDDTR